MSQLLITALLHGTVLFGVTWVLTRFVFSARIKAALWLIVVAKFAVPFSLPLSFSFSTMVSSVVTLPEHGIEGAAHESAFPLGLSVYVAVVAALVLRRVRAAVLLKRRVDAAPRADAATTALVQRLASKLGVSMPVVREGVDGPFTFGWFSPVLLLPKLALESPEREAIVLHELAHLRRRDPWALMLQWVSQVLFFFWPPVRLANAYFDEARELACDELAIRHSGLSPAHYARCLLSVFRTQHAQGALAMVSHTSHLERRIDMLLKVKPKAASKLGAVVVLWGALALAGSKYVVSPSTADGSVARELIQKVVKAHRVEIRFCFEAALSREPGLAGKILVDFTIGRDGKVTEAGIETKQTTLLQREVQQCIISAVSTWQFPKPEGDGVVRVSYPFVFIQGSEHQNHDAE